MKNLKKKVALLLALVMMLSLVPAMNVFGAPVTGVSIRIQNEAGNLAAQQYRAFFRGAPQTVNFDVTFAPFFTAGVAPGMQTAIVGGSPVQLPGFALRFRVTCEDDWNAGPWFTAPVSITTAPAVNWAIASATPAIVYPNSGWSDWGWHEIRFTGDTVAQGGTLTIAGTAVVPSDQAVLYVEMYVIERDSYNNPIGGQWVTVVAGQSLVRPAFAPPATPDQGLNITNVTGWPYDGPGAWFGLSTLDLNSIGIAERAMGTLRSGDQFTVTLTAPVGYTWRRTPTPTIVSNIGATLNGIVYVSGDGRIMRVPVVMGTRPATQITPGNFRIAGLHLVPDSFENRPAVETIYVGVVVDAYNPTGEGTTPFPHGAGGAFRGETAAAAAANFNALLGRSATVNMGEYRSWGLRVETIGTTVPTMVSGRVDQDTVTITIIEEAPESLNLNAPITVRIDNPGVRIAGAETRVFRLGATGDSAYGRTRDAAVQDIVLTGQMQRNLLTFVPSAAQLQNLYFRYNRNVVEITLHLDLEPNFAGNSYNSTIEGLVSVIGFGAADLSEADRTLTLATVVDPVSINNVTPALITPQGADLMGAFASSLPNVTLTESEAGAIRAGGDNFLMVYVVPTMGGLSLFESPLVTTSFATNLQATVTGRGLNLGTATRLNPGQGQNTSNFIAYRFPVNSASLEAGTVTFTGNILNGVLFGGAGVEFELVVGGTALIDEWNFDDFRKPYTVTVGTVGTPIDLEVPGPGPTPTPAPTPGPIVQQPAFAPVPLTRLASNGVPIFVRGGDYVNIRGLVEIMEGTVYRQSSTPTTPGVSTFIATGAGGATSTITIMDGAQEVMVAVAGIPMSPALFGFELINGSWYIPYRHFATIFGFTPRIQDGQLALFA